MPLTDRELLSAFVKNADGAAFAALTERHLGLVFGVACRRTGSREMAQEAAQNTFCRLARQAPKLSVGTSLGPWLHAVALRESGTLLRAEAARQRAMQRLASSTRPPESEGFSAPPPPGSEHLDEALAALPEAARRVLVLRYLQGMSLREVALEEDTSEGAARKRVTRALEHLTRLLARRGVTSASVTACLATGSLLWPAPTSAATLAARAVKQAAVPAAGAGLSGMAGFALSQWPVAAMFLLTALPVAWPWGVEESSKTKAAPSRPIADIVSNGERQAENDKSKRPADTSVISAFTREMRRFASMKRNLREVLVVAGGSAYSETFDEFDGDATRLAATRRAVLDFSLEEVREAARSAEGQPWGDVIEESLYARWAELMPEEARQMALKKKSSGALAGVFRAQAATNLPEALSWAAAHAPDQCHALMAPLARTNPKEYLRLMEGSVPKGVGPNRNQQYLAIFPDAPDVALAGWRESEKKGELRKNEFSLRELADRGFLKPEQAETIAALAGDLPEDSSLRAECFRAVSRLQFAEAPDRAADSLAMSWIPSMDGDWTRDMQWMLKEWKEQNPAAAAGWLRSKSSLDPDTQARLALLAGLTLPPAETSHPISTP